MVSRKTAKAKGSAAERALLHMFYDAGWAAMRAAGSGSIPLEMPDILAGNGTRAVAVEVKTCGNDRQYLRKQEIHDLLVFSQRFGAEAWVGVKFDRRGWFFVPADQVPSSGENYVVSIAYAKEHGKSFTHIASY